MITFKDWCVSLGSVALLVFSFEPSLALQYNLPSSVVRVGERAVVEVRIPIPSNLDMVEGEQELPSVQDELLSDSTDFVILNKEFRREKGAWVWRYELTSYSPGQHRLPPIQVWMGPDNYSTESRVIDFTTLRSEGDLEMRPELGPVSPPLPWEEWIGYAVIVAMVIAVEEFLRRRARGWLKRFQQRRKPKAHVNMPPNQLDWLKQQFLRFRQELDSQTYSPLIVDEITHTIREYLTRTTPHPVVTWTTREFSKHYPNAEQSSPLVRVFEKTDQFKFSGKHSLSIYDLALFALDEGEKVLLLCGR